MNLNLGAAFKRSIHGQEPAIPPAFPETAGPPAVPSRPAPTNPAEDAAYRFISATDVRNLTPRQMSFLCGELFLAGMISCDEYLMMAFQPELHPDYDHTVGALIGEKADPDRPRDYIRRWAERLDFERAHSAGNPALIGRARNILSVLRRLDAARGRLAETRRDAGGGLSLEQHAPPRNDTLPTPARH